MGLQCLVDARPRMEKPHCMSLLHPSSSSITPPPPPQKKKKHAKFLTSSPPTFKQQGEISLTDSELALYDGSDPKKPIYLALNGTIYDVSISPTTYGPGGSYHFFAGRDAARAFLTGCFAEDSVPDLRGVEQMYMPVDPEHKVGLKPEEREKEMEKARTRKKLTKGELKNRHAQELKSARKQVVAGLESWHKLFRGDKGKKYRRVGTVKREEGWLEKMPKRGLCENAEKGRPVRKYE